MNVWCKNHRVLMFPKFSGYNPPAEWTCVVQPLDRLTLMDIASQVGPPHLIAGVVYHRINNNRQVRLVGFPHGGMHPGAHNWKYQSAPP